MAKKVNPAMYIAGGFFLLLFIFGVIAVVLYPTPYTVESHVELGDTVAVEYVGTFDNGTVFDSNEGKLPLVFTVGEHEVVKGFEDAVLGMTVGETKEVRIAPEDAYPYNEDAVVSYKRSDVIEMLGSVPEVGAQVRAGIYSGVVTSVNDTTVVVDFNPPVAGQYLNFKITVLEIKEDESLEHS
ncbi:FKBP-type peptidyl-prolyl cis-trans isomerase [Methanolapillus ohkumae]|uniref:Peptidyl-prolyl cis-trans isomerase n=1 Tax=Methanolapillus ohkumae TaxID=3028298 RepID=A0AA96V5I3_9EURY|nr:Trigger factor [Methanosarcinaceae archaeon Am2]